MNECRSTYQSPTPRKIIVQYVSIYGTILCKSATMSFLLLLFCLLSIQASIGRIRNIRFESESSSDQVKGSLNFTLRVGACNVEGPVVILRIRNNGLLPDCLPYNCKSVQFMYYTCSL